MIVTCYYTILTLLIVLVWHYFSVHQEQLILQGDSSLAMNSISSSSWTIWTGKYPEIYQDLPITNRKQHGYFLHITDMHIDEDYIEGGTVKSACHKLPDHYYGTKQGGIYGAPGEQCDAPVRLAQETLDWISKEWKGKLDFIVWTGDNAKHDWDKKHKRKRKHVYKLNQRVTDMMMNAFWIKDKIPIIPSFGNNDVFPHNECSGDDKELLGFYEQLFRPWVPVEQRATFREGGYYMVKVAPQLNVLSLNSLFFYTKNTEARHCLRWDSPGAIQLQWFINQLKRVRRNNEKVYVIGHVPPSPRDYKSSCLTEYVRIAMAYQDVIMGHFFAHLNMDHFLMFDSTDALSMSSFSNRTLEQDDHLFHTTRNTEEYMGWLQDMYSAIDPSDNKNGGNIPGNRPPVVVIQVAPSILPVYNPSFRIYQYEIEPNNLSKKDDDDTKPYGTVLGYAQYYANLTKWNTIYNKKPLEYELEYTTNEAYGMEDLTVESYFEFAKTMLEDTVEGKKLWSAYRNHMLVRTQNFTSEQ